MERRTFLLGLVGGLAAAAGLAGAGASPAHSLPLRPEPITGGDGTETAEIRPEDLDEVRIEPAWHRRWHRRYYWRPRRRHYYYRPRRRYRRRRYYW
jgi:hypothetical protein